MKDGEWNGYQIQNALIIVLNGQPKILCAWFLKGQRYDESWKTWTQKQCDKQFVKQTELHLTVCRKVPEHIRRLWEPGARATDHRQQGPQSWWQGPAIASRSRAKAKRRERFYLSPPR